MNSENNPRFRSPPLGVQAGRGSDSAWHATVIGWWMRAAFLGMSLIATAVALHFGSAARPGPAELFAIGVAGALLTAAAVRGVVRGLGALERAERAPARQAPRSSVTINPAPAQARITGITPTL